MWSVYKWKRNSEEVWVCVCVWVSEWVSVCVWVSECLWVSECVCVSECVWVSVCEWASVCVCVSECVCVCERERECESIKEESLYMYTCSKIFLRFSLNTAFSWICSDPMDLTTWIWREIQLSLVSGDPWVHWCGERAGRRTGAHQGVT